MYLKLSDEILNNTSSEKYCTLKRIVFFYGHFEIEFSPD